MAVKITTVLLKNIHCASCVAHIQSSLQRAYPRAIQHVDVNILKQEVYVQHDASAVSTLQLCHVLDDAAFEVYGAQSNSEPPINKSEISPPSTSGDSYPSRSDSWCPYAGLSMTNLHHSLNQQSPGPRSSCLPMSRSAGELYASAIPSALTSTISSTASPNRRHIQHCEACQKEQTNPRPVSLQRSAIEAQGATAKSRVSVPNSKERRWRNRSDDSWNVLLIPEESGLAHPEAATTTPDSIVDPGTSEKCDESTWQATLSIGGMTCASCTGAVTKALEDLSYVQTINVTLLTNSAEVRFLGKSHLADIVALVEDLGYDCQAESVIQIKDGREKTTESANKRHVSLIIYGLYCQHCPPKIIKRLSEMDGFSIHIEEAPSLEHPVVKMTYMPANGRTIRDIISALNSLDPAFAASIHHAPSLESRSQAMQRNEQLKLLIRFIITLVIAIPTFLIGVVWMSLVPSTNIVRQFFDQPIWSGTVTRRDWALFILATPTMVYGADVFHVRAFREIRALWRPTSRVPILKRFYRFGSMNLLISLGTTIAYTSSIAVIIIEATTKSGLTAQGSTYFDSVVFLTLFILFGRWLEVYSKAKTGNAVALLANLRSPTANLLTNSPSPSRSLDDADLTNESDAVRPDTKNSKVENTDNDFSFRRTEEIATELLEIGDIVLVRQGESSPADGILCENTAIFNESSITGESRPVKKVSGDTIYAGAINVGNAISVKITGAGGRSMLDQIISVVREGQTRRAPVERIVDSLTSFFVPVITGLAILTWIIWLSLGQTGTLDPRYLGSSARGGWSFWSLEFAIAVFVVACPCGIGLAAPTALFVGSGLAAKHGILVRGGGEAFQEASSIDAVVFDKTGTLTEGGDLQVTDHDVLVDEGQVEQTWEIIRCLEAASSHPIARAIHAFASMKSTKSGLQQKEVVEDPGHGLQMTFESCDVKIEAMVGSESFIQTAVPRDYWTQSTIRNLSLWKQEAKSVAVLATRESSLKDDATPAESNWTIAAIFATSDAIRESASSTIAALRRRDIPVYMLTGDNPTTAAAVARSLDIPEDHVFAGILPTEKADRIRKLQSSLSRQARERSFKSRVRRFLKTSSQSKISDTDTIKKGSNDLEKGFAHEGRPISSSLSQANATIAFIGDGINDAPALSAADVSISFSNASDIAMQSSSFILLNSHDPLSSLITLFDLSRRVFRRVKFNFAWAVVYNLILVPVAAGCFFATAHDGWRLSPVWGSAAMAASSVCVILSSLALRWE